MGNVICQHCFGLKGTGGPIKGHDALLNSKLASEFEFVSMVQTEPAGGINIKLLKRFYDQLTKCKPDLIHVRGIGNEGFHGVLAARLARVPRILMSVHGTVRDLKYIESKTRHWVVRNALEPISLRWATHIATVSKSAATRGFLIPYKSKLIGTVPNGVELPVRNLSVRASMRRELGASVGEVLAVCVSRLTTEKGYLVLAEALREMDSVRGKLRVIVVGEGPDREKIATALSQAGTVPIQMLGLRHDVGSILQAADLFLFPTLHENLSNALLEAMSHSLPVVGTAVGGNVEVLSQGGGVLVPPSDVGALRDAIRMYVNDSDRRRRDGVRARKTIVSNYTIDHMIARWGDVYHKILG